jgi:hypothetical protein
VYGLFDPREPGLMMYVGKTKRRLQRRLLQHLGLARNHVGSERLSSWMRQLLTEGVEPGIKALCLGDADKERQIIRLWRRRNPKLLNVGVGGRQVPAVERDINMRMAA